MLINANDASRVSLNATLRPTRVILPLPRGMGRTVFHSRSRMGPGAESSQGDSMIPNNFHQEAQTLSPCHMES